jgi:hypothetical protein
MTRAILVTLVLALVAAGAHAAEPSAADRDTARGLMQRGDEKLAGGDVQGARDEYQAADRIMQVPTTGLALAKVELQLGHLVEARDVLLRVSRHPVSEGESSLFAEARTEAGALATEVEPRIPTLTISIMPAVAGVEVKIDEDRVDAATLTFPRRVNPGAHVVTASAPGHRAERQTVTLAERDQKALSFVLTAAPEPAPAPAAEPSVDGNQVLFFIGLSVAIAGGVAGIATGSVALARTSKLDDECRERVCSIREEDEIDLVTALSHASTASFAIAGAGAVAGTVGLVLWLQEDDAEPATAAVVVGPGMIGFEMRLR